VATVETLLGNWERLNDELPSLSLQSVRQLIEAEVEGARREHFIRRLHGRYRKLNLPLERAALLRGEYWPIQKGRS